MANITVRLFHELRNAVGQSEVKAEASSLGDVLNWLFSRYGGLRELLLDAKGNIRNYVLIYLNNQVQNPVDLSTSLKDGDLVLLVPPAAGG